MALEAGWIVTTPLNTNYNSRTKVYDFVFRNGATYIPKSYNAGRHARLAAFENGYYNDHVHYGLLSTYTVRTPAERAVVDFEELGYTTTHFDEAHLVELEAQLRALGIYPTE